MSGLMAGKRGLIMGLANDKSLAWGIAKKLSEAGAELAFSYQGAAMEKRVRPLAEQLGVARLYDCDVGDMAALDALQTGERHCDDCCRQSCQMCQQALNAAGCKANGGDACYACVKKLPGAGAAMKACGSQDPLAFRACYIG